MSRQKKAACYLGGLLVFVLAVTAPQMVRGWEQKRAFSKVFESYSRALVQGDYQSAYNTAGREFRAATSFEEFARLGSELVRENGHLASVTQGPTVAEGRGNPTAWAAVTTASFHFTHGSVKLKYEFHLERDQWRLVGFQRE